MRKQKIEQQKLDYPELFHNCASDIIPLEVEIFIQDSLKYPAGDLYNNHDLKEEIIRLYSIVKVTVKVTYLNELISVNQKFSDSIEKIINHKPDGLTLIFITSSQFYGEGIHPEDLVKKYSDNSDITFIKRTSGVISNQESMFDYEMNKNQGEITKYLETKGYLKKKELATA